jgi:hypothetical protein
LRFTVIVRLSIKVNPALAQISPSLSMWEASTLGGSGGVIPIARISAPIGSIGFPPASMSHK